MINEQEIRNNIKLVSAIKNCFFAGFLPDSHKVISELIQVQKEDFLDLESLLTTRNRDTRDFLFNFLPTTAEFDFFENGRLRNELIKVYELKKPKFGLPQIILELYYDSRFREELDNRVDNILEKTKDKNQNNYESFNLIPGFMDKIKDSWHVVDINERESAKRRLKGKGSLPYVNKFEWYDFKSVTEIKEIGKKTKGSEPEKIDNIYSAYKVYGQGEYSKFLIGYKANPKCKSLNDYIYEGRNDIYTKLNDKYHLENKTKDDLIQLGFKLSDREKYLDTRSVDLDSYKYKYQKHFQITEAQIKYIYKELQKFSGNYVPVCLDDKYNGTKTILDHLYEDCKLIVGSMYKKRFNFDDYETGLPFTKDETQFIKKFYDEVAAYRLELTDEDRTIFDKETTLDNGFSFELSSKIVKTFDKIDLLEKLELIAKNSSLYDPIKNWFNKPTWNSIKEQRNLDNTEALQEVQKINKPILSDEIIYKGGATKDGQTFAGTFSAADFADSDGSRFDMLSDESGSKDFDAEEYANELNESYETEESEEEIQYSTFDNSNYDGEDEASKYLFSLFDTFFYNEGVFLGIIKRLVELQIQKKIRLDKGGQKFSDETMDSYNALLYLFTLCDSVHSYSKLWTYYASTIENPSDDLRDLFREKMKNISNEYKNHFRDKLKDN